MLEFIGLPLSEACKRLNEKNIPFTTLETRSKKGIETGTEFVVRVQKTEDGYVLTWARFQTE